MEDLEQGISALRAGNRAEARKLLANVLRQDQDNLRAWQWMFNASKNDSEKKYCLEQILRVDPKNKKAIELLIDLQFDGKQPDVPKAENLDDFGEKLSSWVNKTEEWPEMNKFQAQLENRKVEIEEIKTLTGKTKKCPFCAELVLEEAQICKHCGKNINSTQIFGQQLATIGKSMQSIGCLLTIFVSIPACLCMAFLLLGGK